LARYCGQPLREDDQRVSEVMERRQRVNRPLSFPFDTPPTHMAKAIPIIAAIQGYPPMNIRVRIWAIVLETTFSPTSLVIATRRSPQRLSLPASGVGF
jgi:hypothetical protein